MTLVRLGNGQRIEIGANHPPFEGLAFLTSAISRIGPGTGSGPQKIAAGNVGDPPSRFRGRQGRLGRGNLLPFVGDYFVKNRGHESTNAIREVEMH